MKYRVENNRIIFSKTQDFDAKSILTCGQMFRYFETNDGYEVITGKNKARIIEGEKEIIIETDNPARFIEFFDLNTDYGEIKNKLKKYPILKKAIEFGKGIRIAKGDQEEIIFHFIISQNNNIKRIQQIIEKMSQIGEKIDDKHNAFPTASVLSKKDLNYFKSLGAGYRDVFLYQTAKVLAQTDLKEKAKLSSDELYQWLLSLKGVGPKVASCIMLFGFDRKEFFPVDTWIEKVYRKYFYQGEKTRPQIASFLQEKFGVMSGITQQYLFHFSRNSKDFDL